MANIITKIYKLSPVWIQNIGISVYGYYWNKRRFGGVFEKELEGFKEREFYTKEQWDNYQIDQLRELLLHAYDNVSFYHDKYTKAGFQRSDFEKFKLEDLNRLPFLSKEELRKYCKTSLLATTRERKGEFYPSSGSSGTPTHILFSVAMHQRWSAAYEARIRYWAGINKNMGRAMIGGRQIVVDNKPPFYRYNRAEKQLYMSLYHISPATAISYYQAIVKYKVQYVAGYARSIYNLARFLKDQNINFKNIVAVVTSSEKLTSVMKSTIEDVFGCKAYDGYSGIEACGLISESDARQLLISPDVGILEILNKKLEPVRNGEMGEVVSTGFLNYDQPLIRYRIGDLIELSENQTTLCGRNMPVVNEIIGRVGDIVKSKDGRELAHFNRVFHGISGLRLAQVIQFNIDRVCVNVVVDNDFDELLASQTITERMQMQLGEDMDIEVKIVDVIEREQNGKFKAVISHLESKWLK